MLDQEFELQLLIYGVFLQDFAAIMNADERQILDKRDVAQPYPTKYSFWGVIGKKDNGQLTGSMKDVWGESILTEIKASETSLSFVKRYVSTLRDGSAGIEYSFERTGLLWSGKYESRGVGRNLAMCILYAVQPELFQFG